MSSTTYNSIDLDTHLITYITHFHFPMKKSLSIFSSIACKSMIASSKQRQNHNNLATIYKEKLKGAHERSKSLKFVKS